MDTETLKALAEIVEGLSGDTKQVIVAFLAFQAGQLIFKLGVAAFIISYIVRTVTRLITNCLLTKEFQEQVELSGEVYRSDRELIRRVWRYGLEKWEKEKKQQ